MEMEVGMHESTGAASSNVLPSTVTASTVGTHAVPMPGMAMAMTFSTSTRVTILFDGWTTRTPGAYAAAILLLFMVSVFHRYLGSLRAQLEQLWHKRQQTDEEAAAGASQKSRWRRMGVARQNNCIVEDGSQETQPLSPRVPRGEEPHDHEEKARSWTPKGQWHWRKHCSRAILEFFRATIGYLLMLAVMTFNVGVFFAVLSGVFIGELIFGQYTQGSLMSQDGGCHD